MQIQGVGAMDARLSITEQGCQLTEVLQVFVAQLFGLLAGVEKEVQLPEIGEGLEKEEEFLCRAVCEWIQMLNQDDCRVFFDELLALVKEQIKYEKRATVLVERSWMLVVSYQFITAGLIYSRNNFDPQRDLPRLREHLQRAAICCEAAGAHGMQESLQLLMMVLPGE